MTRSALLEPITIGSVTIPNRVVSTANGVMFADWYVEETDGERYIAYQDRRARGEIGLIIARPLRVISGSRGRRRSARRSTPGSWPSWRTAVGGWSRLSTSTAPRSSCNWGCRAARSARTASRTYGPCGSLDGGVSSSGEVSHKVTEDEVEAAIGMYVELAGMAPRAGFDGVELHGAHGLLLQQSYSLWGNARDRFSEPTAFGTAIVSGIRSELGLGLRRRHHTLVHVQSGATNTSMFDTIVLGVRGLPLPASRTSCGQPEYRFAWLVTSSGPAPR